MLGQVGNSTLEAGIVVDGHLIGDVVVPGVIVGVITVRASNKGTSEGLWVGCRAVLLGGTTGGGNGAAARAGSVVGPQGRVLTKANHEAPASVTKEISDLVVNKLVTLGILVAHLSKLEAKSGFHERKHELWQLVGPT